MISAALRSADHRDSLSSVTGEGRSPTLLRIHPPSWHFVLLGAFYMTRVPPDTDYFPKALARPASTGNVLQNLGRHTDIQSITTDNPSYFVAHTTLRASVSQCWQEARRTGVLAGSRPDSLRRKAHAARDDGEASCYNPDRSTCCYLSPFRRRVRR